MRNDPAAVAEASIEALELAAADSWRAPEQERLGGWRLRAADGFTGRANSALAAGDPGRPLPEAVEAVRAWYRQRGLPPMISVPFPLAGPRDSAVDGYLEERGWRLRSGAAPGAAGGGAAACRKHSGAAPGAAGGGAAACRKHSGAAPGAAGGGAAACRKHSGAAIVMTGPAGLIADAADDRVELAAEPDQEWLAGYHYRGTDLPPIARRLLLSAPWQAFGSVRADGRTVAIGRVAAAGDWAGVTAIEVDPGHRRRGLASAMTGALAAAAASRGVTGLYLQVADENAAARALYRQLGFTEHHRYHYRVAPG